MAALAVVQNQINQLIHKVLRLFHLRGMALHEKQVVFSLFKRSRHSFPLLSYAL